MAIDYVARVGCVLTEDEDSTTARLKDHEVAFLNLAPDVLREKLNAAMEGAVAHYRRNVAKSGVEMPPARVEEASLCVVLHHLFVYNLWRNNYPDRKDQPLVVGPEEIAHVQSDDECLHYCEREYGPQYAKYAAALLAMSAEEFARYEEGRNQFWDR
jgi:hypothetical protein